MLLRGMEKIPAFNLWMRARIRMLARLLRLSLGQQHHAYYVALPLGSLAFAYRVAKGCWQLSYIVLYS